MTMTYRYLGRSGLKVSTLSFGSWATFDHKLDVDAAAEIMGAAFEAGCNFFDNAEAYAEGKSERVMGEAIRKLDWRRDEYVLSTKIFWGGEGPNQRGLSRKHIVEGTRASLDRMQHDHVDLLFCHRPDPHTPIEETVRAMSHVIDRGWAFYWGTSEWTAEQFRHAWAIARREHLVPPLMEQPQYNLFHRERVEREYAPLYDDLGLGTTTWSPLASGILTGKYNDGIPAGSRLDMGQYQWLQKRLTDDRIDQVRQLSALADDLECTTAQLAIAWCAANPDVSTVITGATSVEQVEENMAAIEIVDRLGDAVMDRIDDLFGRPEPPSDPRDG